MAIELIPRLIRFRDAPAYLGMSKHEFNNSVRPNIVELKIGEIGIAFDRLDLDDWIEDHKSRSERPKQEKLWDGQKQVASLHTKAVMGKRSTRSIKNTSENGFLEEVSKIMKKQKSS